jgi:toxin ParE1/3/4
VDCFLGHFRGAPHAHYHMRIVWSPEAIVDLSDLREHIASDNPEAARRVALAIVSTVEVGLSENPKQGRPGRVPDTRELVIPNTPVIVPYRIRDTTLDILGVYHHARSWPEHF